MTPPHRPWTPEAAVTTPVAAPPEPPSYRATIWRRGWWRWSPSRPATRPNCSTWTSTWRPTSASTRSSRPNCSPRSARPTGSPRRLAQAARLPDPQPRHRLRPRPHAPGDADHADDARRTDCGRRGLTRGRRGSTRPSRRILTTIWRRGWWRLVAEQTGYPPELLDLDLDLEADLGIDTVKQAELFAQVRANLRDRTRRLAQAARLPDPQPRHRLRPRPLPAINRPNWPLPPTRSSHPSPHRPNYPSTTPDSHAACRYRSCDRLWTGSRRPACGWRPAPESSSFPTPVGWLKR